MRVILVVLALAVGMVGQECTITSDQSKPCVTVEKKVSPPVAIDWKPLPYYFDWETVASGCIETVRSFSTELMTCKRGFYNRGLELTDAINAVGKCESELQGPHLPLYVNPGECYRIGGDMSLIRIECPVSNSP